MFKNKLPTKFLVIELIFIIADDALRTKIYVQ